MSTPLPAMRYYCIVFWHTPVLITASAKVSLNGSIVMPLFFLRFFGAQRSKIYKSHPQTTF
jgi:hypothetical protein